MNVTIEQLTAAYSFKNAKALGQNFLADEDAQQGIVDGLGAGPEDTVIEIGPGLGVLTVRLAPKVGRLIAVELDERLIPILHDRLDSFGTAEIVNADILKTDIKSILLDKGEKLQRTTEQSPKIPYILGNLPYYITTPILMKFIEEDVDFKAAVFMVQLEVAEKMMAAPSKDSYGVLAAILQYFFDMELLMEVPPEAFIPAPKVTSAVVRLVPNGERMAALGSKTEYVKLVKKAFSQRRKTLGNSLIGWHGMDKAGVAAWLLENGIDPQRRPENLSPEEFAKLANALR